MLTGGGITPSLSLFLGHVVKGTACIQAREVIHTWTIAAEEKSVKKFFQKRHCPIFPGQVEHSPTESYVHCVIPFTQVAPDR